MQSASFRVPRNLVAITVVRIATRKRTRNSAANSLGSTKRPKTSLTRYVRAEFATRGSGRWTLGKKSSHRLLSFFSFFFFSPFNSLFLTRAVYFSFFSFYPHTWPKMFAHRFSEVMDSIKSGASFFFFLIADWYIFWIFDKYFWLMRINATKGKKEYFWLFSKHDPLDAYTESDKYSLDILSGRYMCSKEDRQITLNFSTLFVFASLVCDISLEAGFFDPWDATGELRDTFVCKDWLNFIYNFLKIMLFSRQMRKERWREFNGWNLWNKVTSIIYSRFKRNNNNNNCNAEIIWKADNNYE